MKQCCHINLPLLYGMNNAQRPFYIDTSFMEDLKPVTLKGVVQKERGAYNSIRVRKLASHYNAAL